MANIGKRRTEKVEMTAVSITGEPKTLKAKITYEQKLTVGQMLGIGVSSAAACGIGYCFGRWASKCKDSKIVKTLDRMFGIDEEDFNENVEYVDIDVVDEEE